MKKHIFLLLMACLIGMGQAWASDRLTISDVNVPQGGQATLEIGCEFDTEYTAFELQLALPKGLSLLTDEDGYPIIEKAFSSNHILSGNLLPSNGNYKITCRSMENLSMPTNGPLFRVTVQADASLALGTSLNATVTASEFTRTADSQGKNLEDVSFFVNISEFRTVLDETSTSEPKVEIGANVRVLRTIKAGEWNTICLPFAMTEAQMKTAFGNDVQLGDFNDYEVSANGDHISVKFIEATAIEANHPYIIKVGKAVTEFTVDGVDIDPQEAVVDFDTSRRKNQPRQMVGTYTAGTELEWGTLFLSGNQFWYSVGNTKMKAFRAYFNFIDLLPDFEENYEVRQIKIVFGDETTGLELLNNLTIARYDDCVYDLQGRKISNSPMKKGIYVKDGKKVLIK